MPHETAHRQLPVLLLIDDDEISREVVGTLLSLSGYAVDSAADGEAAFEMLATGGSAPGLILMDAQMPGLSGLLLIAALRAQTDARICLISASAPPEDLRDAADGFLLKPFTPTDVDKLFDGQQAIHATISPETNGILDAETLAGLRKVMPETAIREIFTALIADMKQRLSSIEDALAAGDADRVRHIGHSIKGACGMVGAAHAARLGALIEAGALDGAVPTAGVVTSGVNQLDNNVPILNDLHTAIGHLERILSSGFSA